MGFSLGSIPNLGGCLLAWTVVWMVAGNGGGMDFVCGSRNYTGYQVLRVFTLNSTENVQIIQELTLWANNESRKDAFIVCGSPNDDHMDLAVHEDHAATVKDLLRRRDVPYSTLINDLTRVINRCQEGSWYYNTLQSRGTTKRERKMNWNSYQSLDSIYAFMSDMAATFVPITVETIGRTYEDRDIKVLKINTANSKYIFWINAGMHGREWIGPAVVTYFIREMAENYTDHMQFIDAFQWYILPVSNPDGYEYSRTEDRLWTKTRSENDYSRCKGVDPNKNFNFQWMIGGSDDPCSDNYAGPGPETEETVVAIRDKLLKLTRQGSVMAFFSYNSYGQIWAWPWGWTNTQPRTYEMLKKVAQAGAKAIKKVHGKIYKTGSISNLLGKTSGTVEDWAFGAVKIPFVSRIELRDEGAYGYALPPQEIIPTAEESFAGLRAAAGEILRIFQSKIDSLRDIRLLKRKKKGLLKRKLKKWDGGASGLELQQVDNSAMEMVSDSTFR